MKVSIRVARSVDLLEMGNIFVTWLELIINQIYFLGKQGLAGAAERMRNLVSQELDVVVSVKEAKLSREQLLKDRTTMSKQLADMKRKQRVTMTSTEREEMNKKITELEEEMTLRNAQISELQKQIYDIDSTNEHDNNQHKLGKVLYTMLCICIILILI